MCFGTSWCVVADRPCASRPPQGPACYGRTHRGYPCHGRPWSEIFPSASEACLELLSRMLVFNPAKRCSMEDALTCEYMAPLHQQRPLPEQESSFSFDFEKPNVSQEALRELIHAEMLNFHPNSGSEDPK